MINSKHLTPNIPSSKLLEIPQVLRWSLSDYDSVPTSGLTETDRLPNEFSCSDIRLSLSSGDTTTIISVDILKNGVSIFEVPVTIPVSGTTSVGGTPFIFTSSATTVTFDNNNKMDFIVSGATDGLGLKVRLIGNNIITSIGTDISDDFNRADELVNVSANWADAYTNSPPSKLHIVGNEVTSNTTGWANVYWTGDTFNANQYSEATITDLSAFYFNVNIHTLADDQMMTWMWRGGTTMAFDRINPGGGQSLKGIITDITPLVIGDVIRIEAEGTTYRGYINGVLISTITNTEIVQSGSSGLGCFNSNGLDNWSGGNLN